MSDQDVTLGEVARKVDTLNGAVTDALKALGEMPKWADVARVEKGLEEKVQAVSARLAKTEGWGSWATKLALGAVGTAIIAGNFPGTP